MIAKLRFTSLRHQLVSQYQSLPQGSTLTAVSLPCSVSGDAGAGSSGKVRHKFRHMSH